MELLSDTAVSPTAAFRLLRPITLEYATVPIADGFSWSVCAANLPAGEWYMVVFRSVRRESGEHLILEMHDYGAYIEAQRRAFGLLHYFRGTPNERDECLSFCIWTNREEAARAARLPLHMAAIQVADDVYESYSLERHIIRKRPHSHSVEIQLVPMPASAQASALMDTAELPDPSFPSA